MRMTVLIIMNLLNKLLEYSKFNNIKLKMKFESFREQHLDIIKNYDQMTNPK